MSVVMSDIERLRDLIAERAGARVRDEDLPALEELLRERMRLLGRVGFDDYAVALDDPDELAALTHRLVAGETYFFRVPAQFRALESIFEDWKRRGRRPPRILSAGCATGEEAYSIAIAAQRYWSLSDVSIMGIDMDPARLAVAQAARYSPWSLRAVGPLVRSRYFRRVGRRYEVVEPVRSSVRFRRWNLVRPLTPLGQFDVIFCRNVMIYFDATAAAELASRLSTVLSPQGYLFTSHAEHVAVPCLETRRFDQAFVHAHASPDARRITPLSTELSIAKASASKLVTPTPRSPRRPRLQRGVEEEVVALLHRERYREALSVLESVPEPTPHLEEMRAALLFATGALDDATRLAARLRDESRVGSLVAGLCAESRGDRATAELEYRLATQGPTRIALAHMRLGLLVAERDPELAKRELRAACDLMPAENPTIVLLFGGGFGAEALHAVCATRLELLEEASA